MLTLASSGIIVSIWKGEEFPANRKLPLNSAPAREIFSCCFWSTKDVSLIWLDLAKTCQRLLS